MPLNPELPGFGALDGSTGDSTPGSSPNPLATQSSDTGTGSPLSEVAVKEISPRSTPPGEGPPPPPDTGAEEGSGAPPEMNKMSFLEHLEELRRRIFYSLAAVGIGVLVCWTFADEIYAGMARPLTQTLRELHMEDQLVYTNPVAPFNLYIQLAFLAGLFVASPFVLWQVWRFISPGLYPQEKKYAIPFVLLSSGLFIGGGVFAYTVAFPAALRFLLNFGKQFRPFITINEYFSLASTIILGLALVFELPILILFLTFLRLMTPRFLLRNFRYAVLLVFIVAAIITPTPDIPTMMLFATPLIVLYLFGIGLSFLVLRNRGRSEE